MRTPRSAQTVVRLLCACVAFVVLILVCALPFIVTDDEYGDVPAPGGGTVHLPVGQTDVALCSERLDPGADAVPPPSLSIRISSLDGGPDPETMELRREASGSRCDVVTQIAAVKVLRDGDYRVSVDGDVCCPYEPRLVFGDFVWNRGVLALLTFAKVIFIVVVSLVFGLGVPSIFGVLIGMAVGGLQLLFGKSGAPPADSPSPSDAEPFRPIGLVDWPPEDFVLPYPEAGGRVLKFFAVFLFLLFFGLLVVVPVWATIAHLAKPGPVHWLGVAFLVCWAAGFGYVFWRICSRSLLIRERRARGDGWLRLSASGFEVHGRSGKPRTHDWSDVEAFTLVESTDGEGGVSQHVRIQFMPEHQPAGLNINGYWDCSIEEAVDLMNGWLKSYRLALARLAYPVASAEHGRAAGQLSSHLTEVAAKSSPADAS